MTKNLAAMAIVGVVVFSVPAFAGGSKIGVVDMALLLEKFEQTQTMEGLLEKQVADIREELDRMTERVEKQRDLVNQLQMEAEDRALSEEKREEKVGQLRRHLTQLQDMRQGLARARETRQMELSEQKMRMHRTVLGNIQGYVETFAAREGYVLILDKSGLSVNGVPPVVFFVEEFDVTRRILETMPQRSDGE